MRFSLLASGSQGNCCVIQHKDTSIVIDCGTTKKYLLGAFEQIAYDYQSSDAILITHTHSDHIAQMKCLNKFQPMQQALFQPPICMRLLPLKNLILRIFTSLFFR